MKTTTKFATAALLLGSASSFATIGFANTPAFVSGTTFAAGSLANQTITVVPELQARKDQDAVWQVAQVIITTDTTSTDTTTDDTTTGTSGSGGDSGDSAGSGGGDSSGDSAGSGGGDSAGSGGGDSGGAGSGGGDSGGAGSGGGSGGGGDSASLQFNPFNYVNGGNDADVRFG